jgi:hypothetical protein
MLHPSQTRRPCSDVTAHAGPPPPADAPVAGCADDTPIATDARASKHATSRVRQIGCLWTGRPDRHELSPDPLRPAPRLTHAANNQPMTTPSDATQRIHDHLSMGKPLTLEEIGAWAADEGMTKARNPATYVRDKVRYDRRLIRGDDERWTTIARVLDGRWFTHRVRPDEVAAEALSDEIDLGPVYRAVHAERDHPWQRKREVVALRGTLSGPFRWLPELAPGNVVGLRFDKGRLDVERIAEPVRTLDGARLAQQLRQSLARPSEFDGRLSAHDVTGQVIHALSGQPDLLLDPTLPLSELVPELDRHAGDDLIGDGSGCDFFVVSGDGCWRCRRESTSIVRLEVPTELLYEADRAAALQESSLPVLLAGEVNALLASLAAGSISKDDIGRRSARTSLGVWD